MPVKILMPALSPTMTEGKLAKWLKGEGDKVKSGDVLAEIETDKATMEVEAVDEGVLGKILVQAGTEGVAVNTTIALLLGEGEKASALKEVTIDPPKSPNGKASSPPVAAKASNTMTSAKPQSTPQSTPASSMTTSANPDTSRIFASPLARRLAASAGVDLSKVRGSGPHGRIIKADIDGAASGKGGAMRGPVSQPTTAGALPFEPAFELQPLSMMRKTIARRLTESKQQVPHYYLTVEICLDALLDARTRLNALAGDGGKLSVNDMLIKILGVALKKHPDCNVSYTDEGIKKYASVDVAVAVAIPGGLITPVIRGADQKGLAQISTDMRDLAGKAKSGKLMPEEYQGGTFSLSNLGMFGIREFIAVINPPQAGILAVGAGEQRAIVRDGQVVVATMMMATLSADHRAIDGATGAQMLKTFKNLVENPVAMIL